ncbi:unnamed protein product, partial [Schistosoma turkestanicum]
KFKIINQELNNLKHEYECKIKQLQDTLYSERKKFAYYQEQTNASAKLTQELIDLGNECKGERHHEIIDKQKEAISHLRQRLRDQCMNSSPK